MSRSPPNATLLVIGGGYVGLALAARARAAGLTLRITTRSAARAATLRATGLGEVAQLDLTEADAGARIAALASDVRQVVCLLPPSAGIDAANSLAPWTQLCAVLRSLPDLESAVMASSTAVYGDQAGATVRAALVRPGNSLARPNGEPCRTPRGSVWAGTHCGGCGFAARRGCER